MEGNVYKNCECQMRIPVISYLDDKKYLWIGVSGNYMILMDLNGALRIGNFENYHVDPAASILRSFQESNNI